MSNEQEYAVWPNGDWCLIEDLGDYLGYMSDDYEVTTIDPDPTQEIQL